MMTCFRAVVAALALGACDAKTTPPATSSSAAANPASTPTTSAAAAPPASSNAPAPPTPAVSSSAPAATASAPSSADAATGPCAEGARKDDDARYCITLPAKRLAVSYEGDKPAQGIREELEIAGDRVVITIGPARAGTTAASEKAAALKRIGASLVESGDLQNGYWTDLEDKGGGRIIEGVVLSKYVITCTHWVADKKNVEAARAVCKSLKTF